MVLRDQGDRSMNLFASTPRASSTADPPYTDAELSRFGLDRARLPRHVAVIMDGNGRWARSRLLPRIEGHRRGVASVRNVVETAARLGFEQLTLYCFSSENWKRPEREQRLLMQLLRQFLIEERAELVRQDLRFAVIGRRAGLDAAVIEEIDRSTQLCAGHRGMRLCLAVNYGSRGEIVDAIRRIAEHVANGEATLDDINEAFVGQHLDTAGMPDPDLLIRTAGEMRLSNYLLWQISYAELWVTDAYWPDFRAEQLYEACRAFAQRDRRFGGLATT